MFARSISFAAVALACACTFLAAAPQPTTRRAVLRNVTLIDGTGAPARAGMDVVVEGQRITSVTVSGATGDGSGAEVHDFTGRTVIPGLIDSHMHLMQRYRVSRESAYAELERMLYGGVTTVREMAGDTRLTAEAARTIAVGSAAGPDLYFSAVMAGPQFFTDDPRPGPAARGYTPGQVPWGQAITAETDVRLAVARAAGTLSTGIKLYVQLEPSLVARITDEAHRQGLKVWSHATVYPSRPIEVVRAGVDAISHACGLAWQSTALDPTRFARPNLNDRPAFDPALVRADGAEMTALFAEMKRRGTLFEPTLSIHLQPGDDEVGCTSELVTALTRAAHRAGVPLVAGTDFVAADDDPYPALHLEIDRLVDTARLTALEAITAATRNGARALGIDATIGTIEAGKIANLVVLESDPTRDIRALRSVVAVMKRGAVYHRTSYKRAGKAFTR